MLGDRNKEIEDKGGGQAPVDTPVPTDFRWQRRILYDSAKSINKYSSFMAFIGLFEIFLALIFLLFLYHLTRNIRELWKVLAGILPAELSCKFHDKIAKVIQNRKGTFLVKGSWLGQNNMLFTGDPMNIHHIMSTNFSNYVKGSEWRKRFDIFGEHSLFNADFDEWKHQRKIVRAFLSHKELQQHVAKIIPDIIEKELIPVLERVSEQDSTVDMQDLFTRYTFDFASLIVLGSNPKSLMCIGHTEIPFLKALGFACEAIFVRHFFPAILWKIQQWIGIGKERHLRSCSKIFDQFCANHISIKQEQLARNLMTTKDQEGFNVLTCFLTGHEICGPTPTPNFMRDNLTSLIFAAEDTTSTTLSWFFWLLSKNPFSEMKIREELEKHLPQGVTRWQPCNLDQLNKLVYLHGAICETLRLVPPVPYESRFPLRHDTLPSGHQVDQHTNIVMCPYAMGRMTSIWGEDCLEFKPERWITKDGGIKHEPSHKFFAFIAGPRICPGKEIGFSLMKAIIATIIRNYDVQIVDGHLVTPSLSIVLRMEHGLVARIKKRWA